jgi:glycosyltransferase involved in cell wall biosynthesis
MASQEPLKIVHVLRAPVGGLFRHVLDLADGQAERGHKVGIIAARTDNAQANEKLAAIESRLALGVHRVPMRRHPGIGDLSAMRHVARSVEAAAPEVVHGHGAKGGAYARLTKSENAIRVYTPHGGSLHYGRATWQGKGYALAERLLMGRTDLFLFESAFARDAFEAMAGKPRALVRVVPNGVGLEEFQPVAPEETATDLVMVGELRHIKGVDVLIEALALLAARRRQLTATIVGEGPDGESLRALAAGRGLAEAIRFAGYQPARKAFGMGRILVVPSRAESLPYIVLEAAAAGVPLVATRVGGIPEVFGLQAPLVPPGDPQKLSEAIATVLDTPAATTAGSERLRERVRTLFSRNAMVDGVLAAYGEAIRAKFPRSH